MGSGQRLGGLPLIAPGLRRGQRTLSIQRTSQNGIIAHSRAQYGESKCTSVLLQARQALLAAVVSLAVAVGAPLEAEAKKAAPPPPPPTAYDVRF